MGSGSPQGSGIKTKRTVVADIECNGLDPTKVWVVCAKDVDTGETFEFKNPSLDPSDFRAFSRTVDVWIGHHFLQFDGPIIKRLLGVDISPSRIIDTLVVSRLIDAGRRGGHGLGAWGEHFGRPKPVITEEQWDTFSEDLVHRCHEDVEINFLVYNSQLKYIQSPLWASSLRTEHEMARICHQMTSNGFFFLLKEAKELREEITYNLNILTKELTLGFPKKLKILREVHPRFTKFGTLGKAQFKWYDNPDLSIFNGGPFSVLEWEEFDPASPKQRIERLNEAGWSPYNKTKGHRKLEKELQDLRRKRRKVPDELLERMEKYKVYGWVVDEENLSTLPADAPEAAQKLVQWLMLSNRTSTLETWINACVPSTIDLEGYPAGTVGRIHGNFNSIGTWTHRLSHDRPNVGNIPSFNAKNPSKTPYSDRMRSLWASTPGRYLVGVDAESIQLRIFGHYINDKEFINGLVSGDKNLGTDPHSLNQRALGHVCKSRDDAKTFIYAWLLGAGIPKVATILGCSRDEAEEAVNSFIKAYPGLVTLREEVIPEDAARGFFQGFDGRYVRIKGDDLGSRKHFTLAGYLQNGEKVIMARANIRWTSIADKLRIPYWQVNFVHDEYQTETIRDITVAQQLAQIQADSIREVGEELNLNCPMAGSIYNSYGKLAIADNWYETH